MTGPKLKYGEKMKVCAIRLTVKQQAALSQDGMKDKVRAMLDKAYKLQQKAKKTTVAIYCLNV